MMEPNTAVILYAILVFGCIGFMGWALWDYFRVQRNQTRYIKTKMGKLNITPLSVCKTPFEPASPVDELRRDGSYERTKRAI